MKRIILTLLLVVTATVAFGQNKWQQKQINHFVNAAQNEYKLDEAKTTDLTSFRTEMVLAYHSLQKKYKAGDLTKEARKTEYQKISKAFHNKLIKLTGKSYKELAPFLKKMREELKDLK